MRSTREKLPRLTDRLPLGDSGLTVSPICLGISNPETVLAAYDGGINFFFITNDLHWHHYRGVMEGVSRLLERPGVSRDDIVVAGVSYLCEPMFRHLQLNELLAATPGLERVDVLVAGACTAWDLMPRYHTLRRARAGRAWGCAAIGASFHDRESAAAMADSDRFDVHYVRYNALHPGAEVDLFPHLEHRRRSLLYNFKSTNSYVPHELFEGLGIDEDHWRPEWTDGYRFALTQGELDGLLVSLGHPRHVSALVDALAEGPLDDEERTYMVDLALLAAGRAVMVEGEEVAEGEDVPR